MYLVDRTWYFYLAEMLRTFLKIISLILTIFVPGFPDFSYVLFYPVLINIYFPLQFDDSSFITISVIKLINITSIKVEFLGLCCDLYTI